MDTPPLRDRAEILSCLIVGLLLNAVKEAKRWKKGCTPDKRAASLN